jgi:epoxide hydrolase 4
MDRIEAGDVVLHAVERGSGPAIVFLHGWPEYWQTWEPIMDALAARYRCVAPDLRGCNLSSRPRDLASYVFDAYVRDAVATLHAAGAPAILVGHDIGGFIAWAVAHQHPELVRGLVIVNASHPDVLRDLLATHAEQRAALGFWKLLARFRWPILAGGLFYRRLMAAAFTHHTEPRSILSADEQRRYREAWRRGRWPWQHAMATSIAWYRANVAPGPQLAAHVPAELHIRVPTLVLWGMRDVALLAEPNLAALPAYVPHLRIERFADAGHYVTHEVPHEVARLVGDFAADPAGFVR